MRAMAAESTPASCAAQILRAVHHNHRSVHVGTDSVILCFLRRFWGSTFYNPLVFWPSVVGTLLGVRLIGKKVVLTLLLLFLFVLALVAPPSAVTSLMLVRVPLVVALLALTFSALLLSRSRGF